MNRQFTIKDYKNDLQTYGSAQKLIQNKCKLKSLKIPFLMDQTGKYLRI